MLDGNEMGRIGCSGGWTVIVFDVFDVLHWECAGLRACRWITEKRAGWRRRPFDSDNGIVGQNGLHHCISRGIKRGW